MEPGRVVSNEWEAPSVSHNHCSSCSRLGCTVSMWAVLQRQAPLTFLLFFHQQQYTSSFKREKKAWFLWSCHHSIWKNSSCLSKYNVHFEGKVLNMKGFIVSTTIWIIIEVEYEVIRNYNHILDRQSSHKLEISVPLGLHFFPLSFFYTWHVKEFWQLKNISRVLITLPVISLPMWSCVVTHWLSEGLFKR
jgi:hypothetical protein